MTQSTRRRSRSAPVLFTLLALALAGPPGSAAAQLLVLDEAAPRLDDPAPDTLDAGEAGDPDPALVYLGAGAGLGLSQLGGDATVGAGYFPGRRVAVGVLVRAGVAELGELFGRSMVLAFVEPSLGLLGRADPFTLIFDVGVGAGEASYDESCLDLFGGGCTPPPPPPHRTVGTGSLGLRFLFHGNDGSVYGGGVVRLQTVDLESVVLTTGGELGYAF